jgi:nucleotidyltransferase substrate binding protein (TIGR01987 family)
MDDRLTFQLAQFERAFAALQEAVDTDDGSKKSRDSILLSYVFTFETACKAMRAALDELGLSVPDYASAVLRGALQGRLLSEPGAWEKLREHRNAVAHAYDEDRAVEIAAHVRVEAPRLFAILIDELRKV